MEKYFRCECYSEGIQVERDVETIDYDKEFFCVNVYFAKMHYGTSNNLPTLREKLRHCWRILRTGRNYADEVILSADKARELGNYLLEITSSESIDHEVQTRIEERKSMLVKKDIEDKSKESS